MKPLPAVDSGEFPGEAAGFLFMSRTVGFESLATPLVPSGLQPYFAVITITPEKNLMTSLRRIALAALLLLPLMPAIPVSAQLVEPRGSDTTFDIATWNLRQFPQSGGITVSTLSLMIADLELDLIGLQEIVDEDQLEVLASNIGGWEAIYGSAEGGGLRFGVLYDNTKITIGQPYSMSGSAFTRNPYCVPITMVEAGDTLIFNLAVLHLKAFDSPQDRETREAEIAALKSYLDVQLDAGNGRWVVLGDYNDKLEDSPSTNIFTPLLEDDDYHFLTEPMAGSAFWASWIGSDIPSSWSLIDHIMVTADLLPEYEPGGECETLRLDQEYDLYRERISDHRPVAAYFPAVTTDVSGDLVELPTAGSLRIWPVPANGAVNIAYELPGAEGGEITVYDLLGRSVFRQAVMNRSGRIAWQNTRTASGIYLVRLQQSGQPLDSERILLLK